MVSVEPKQRSKSFGICIIYGLYVHKICQEVHTHTHTPTLECFGERNCIAKEQMWKGTFKESLKFDSCECTTDFYDLIDTPKSNFFP